MGYNQFFPSQFIRRCDAFLNDSRKKILKRQSFSPTVLFRITVFTGKSAFFN